jgi:exodeoxyribonuclease VII small subunit
MPLSPTPDEAAQSFEAAYGELQQLVAELEASDVKLERALELLERGNQLAALCERIVEQAELRVIRLAAESAPPLADA